MVNSRHRVLPLSDMIRSFALVVGTVTYCCTHTSTKSMGLTSPMHVDVATFVLCAWAVFVTLGIVLGRETMSQWCTSIAVAVALR